jgi:hybrid cluster-associated redox disulfide protein
LFQRKVTIQLACYYKAAMENVLITPNLVVAELLNRWPQTMPVFIRHRLYCVGCLMSPFDTLHDVVCNYRLPEQPFFAELRQAIEQDVEIK